MNQTDTATSYEAALQLVWDLIGETPRYPLSTTDVIRFCRKAGRAVDRNRIAYAWRVGQLAQPARENGAYVWTASDVVSLLRNCDENRRWVVGSQVWLANASQHEKARHALKQTADYRDKIDQIGLRHLCLSLLSLTADVHRDNADFLFSAIESKLEDLGVAE
jgi:hypothetical protein